MLKQVRRRRKARAALAPESVFRHAGPIADGALPHRVISKGSTASIVHAEEQKHPLWARAMHRSTADSSDNPRIMK
jgi:hypothetical protein